MPTPEGIAQQAKELEKRSRAKNSPEVQSGETNSIESAPMTPGSPSSKEQLSQNAGTKQGVSNEGNKVVEKIGEDISKILEKLSETNPLEGVPDILEGIGETLNTLSDGQETGNKVLSDVQKAVHNIATSKK
jgi:archaellum component FlaC